MIFVFFLNLSLCYLLLSLSPSPPSFHPPPLILLSGHVVAHHCCAAWSDIVIQTDDYKLKFVDKAVMQALLEKCSYCHRYGASVQCVIEGPMDDVTAADADSDAASPSNLNQRCAKIYHYPCAAAAGCFQAIKR